MKNNGSKFLLYAVALVCIGSALSTIYRNRWIIRFAFNYRVPCVLWTKKYRLNTDALKMISSVLPKNSIIVEAGAYNGTDSVVLANAWDQGSVHSFEPIPQLYKTVVETTKGYKNIFTYPIALSDKEGFADFYVSSSETPPDIPSASSSLLEPDQHLVKAPNVLFKKKITVQTTTLDAWAEKNNIDHVDLLWLDTQGAELAILKNAPKIFKTVKAVLMEVEFVEAYKAQPLFGEIKEWMEAHGFRLEAIHIGCDWYGDALFIRNCVIKRDVL